MMKLLSSLNQKCVAYSPFRRGEGLRARALQGVSWTVVGYGGSQLIRLVSNMLLTRLFLPEVFGIMAIIQLFVQGLAMFSDTGINSAIVQSDRGEQPAFLDTAWTIGVVRGFGLWLAACALAYPLAALYDAADLVFLLPAVAATAIITGFHPTKVATLGRRLTIGKVTAIELLGQVSGTVAIFIAAIWTRSAWAMAIGNVAGAVVTLLLFCQFLPGRRNSWRWCAQSARELFSFGRWIFLGSMAGFVLGQSDRLVLGYFSSLRELGIYNIGWFFGSVPLVLASTLSFKVLMPLYKELSRKNTAHSRKKLFQARSILSTGLIGLALLISYCSPYFFDAFYPTSFSESGILAVSIAIACIPRLTVRTCETSLLANGDSRSFTMLLLANGTIQLALLLFFVSHWSVFGVAVALFLAPIITYPVTASLVRRNGSWMPRHDLAFFSFGLLFAAGAIGLHRTRLAALLADCGVFL